MSFQWTKKYKYKFLFPSLVIFIIIFSFFFPLMNSFKGLVLHDESYIIDGAYRFSLGQVPYRDFIYVTTPLTAMMHGVVFKIFGYQYIFSKIFISFQNVVFTIFLFILLLRFLPILPSFLATLAGSVWFYAIISAPWYDMDAWFFSLFAIFAFLYFYYLKKENYFWLFLTGVFAALSLLSKQNIGGVSLVLGAFSIFLLPRGDIGKRLIAYIIGGSLILILFLVYLNLHGALQYFYDQAIKLAFLAKSEQKYLSIPFFGPVWQPHFIIIDLIILITCFSFLLCIIQYYRDKDKEALVHLLTIIWIGFIFEAGIFSQDGANILWQLSFTGLILGLFFKSFAKELKNNKKTQKLYYFSIILLTIIIFFGGAAISILRKPWEFGLKQWGKQNYKLDLDGFNDFSLDPFWGKNINQLYSFIKREIPQSAAYQIFPNITLIYFATRRIPPSPVVQFYADYVISTHDQQRIIDSWQKNKLKWFILERYSQTFERHTSDYQLRQLPSIKSYIESNFHPYKDLDGFIVLKRINDSTKF
ncbi:hypothetical protein HY029_03700 [Candidatus Gottesmanbacteria bacterium]|nr:hypothetical protein [Candidatus Gottesmanbacteria bacterium]